MTVDGRLTPKDARNANRLLAIVIAVSVIGMSACGNRSPADTSVRPPLLPETSNQSIAADNAAAKAAALKQSDFPTDWDWTAEPQSNGTTSGSIDGRLASCLGVREEQLSKAPTGFDSPNFTRLFPGGDPEPNSLTVSSHVGYRPTSTAQAASFDLFAGPRMPECLGKAVAATVDYDIQHPSKPPSSTTWTRPGPTSSLVGQPSVAQMYVPSFGGKSIRHQVKVLIAAPPIGNGTYLYFDQIIVITGRADVIMDFQATGDPFPTDQEARYTELVVGRLTNIGTKAATNTTTPPPSKINWVQVRPAGPSPTSAVAMTYDPDTHRVVLSDGSNLWTWNGSTWALDGSAHSGAALAYDPDTHQLVVFGGETGAIPPTYFSDTWIRNDSVWTGAWTLARPATSPPARASTTMAYDPAIHRLVLFGGMSAGGFADTWTWNGSTWTQVTPAANPPGGDAMAYDPETHQLVLLGGSVSTDTWTWGGSTWSEATPATSPPGRLHPAMAYDPDIHRMVLFGGMGAHNPLSDTWTWDGSNWTQVTPATNPPARDGADIAYAFMVYDPDTHQLVLFDGRAHEDDVSSLWVLQAG